MKAMAVNLPVRNRIVDHKPYFFLLSPETKCYTLHYAAFIAEGQQRLRHRNRSFNSKLSVLSLIATHFQPQGAMLDLTLSAGQFNWDGNLLRKSGVR